MARVGEVKLRKRLRGLGAVPGEDLRQSLAFIGLATFGWLVKGGFVSRPVLRQDAITTVEDATTGVKLSETGVAFHMVLPVSAAQSGVVAYLKEQWSELKSPRYVGPDLRHSECHKHATTWGRHSQKSLTAPKWAHTRDSRCAASSTRMCPLFVTHFKSASDAGTLLEFPKMETELCISSETNGSVG